MTEPIILTSSYFIRNLETGKLELYFDRKEYKALDDRLKKDVKSHYNWSSGKTAWVSKGSNNIVRARQIAEAIGLEYQGEVGERIPFADRMDAQAERAADRADRMDVRSEAAKRRAEALQAAFNKYRTDWNWITQPILIGHGGSERFGRQRQRIVDRYNRGFEELEKAEHYADRAETARRTAKRDQLKDRGYLGRRIAECHTKLRELGRNMSKAVDQDDEEWSTRLAPMIEEQLDRLAFFTGCMLDLEEQEGKTLSRENIAKGDLVLCRGNWCRVLRTNPNTVSIEIATGPSKDWKFTYPYAEIQDHRPATK